MLPPAPGRILIPVFFTPRGPSVTPFPRLLGAWRQALGACAVMPCSSWTRAQRGCVCSPTGDCRCGGPGSPGLVFPSLAPGELLRARWCSFRRGAPVDAWAAGPSLSAPSRLCLGDRALPPRGSPPVPGHPSAPAPASLAPAGARAPPCLQVPQVRLPTPGFGFSQTCTNRL